MRHHLRRSKRRLFSIQAWKVRLVFWLGALLVGAIAALFALLSEQGNALFVAIAHAWPWAPLVLTPALLVAIAWLTRSLFPGAQGSGIPQAIAALQFEGRSALLTLRIAFGKIVLTVLGLCAGASIGREGPSVHVGAAIMYALGRRIRFRPAYMDRGLILAGGAAGVAAAFNTPLAGIVFAIEEMSKSFEQRTSGIVTIAVVLAGLTALVLLGNYTYFGQSDAVMGDLGSWLAVPICGVIGGLLGGLFSLGMIHFSERLAPFAARHPYRLALGFGLVVALIGYLSGYTTSGTGYEVAKGIITGESDPGAGFPLLKMVATLASYLTGIPGGIFAPSLAAGAGVGLDLGHWIPVAPLSVMVLLGMVGYFSGVIQSPITAFVIVMEMTDNHQMLLALMATSLIASGSSHLVCRRPLYPALAEAFLGRQRRAAPSRESG